MTDAQRLYAFADTLELGHTLRGVDTAVTLRRIANRLRAVDTLKDQINNTLETLTKIKRL